MNLYASMWISMNSYEFVRSIWVYMNWNIFIWIHLQLCEYSIYVNLCESIRIYMDKNL
jgi:hypothetical protein